MKKSRHLPIGVDDFKKLVREYYFVDKTRFIRTLIDGHSQAALFTRPRRFGKTLTLSMLYYFFTLEHAEENRKLFDGCFISQAGDAYMSQQGTRPVIFLSLKGVKALNYPSMISLLAGKIRSLYAKFRYLSEDSFLYPEEAVQFRRALSRELSAEELQESLSLLMEYLDRFHHSPVLLLIDEYDAPMQYAWDNGYYEDAITFLRNFLSAALKTNPHLDFAVLTGVLRIAKESIFSSLNNLDISSVASGSHADVFGFSKKEIHQMAADFGCPEKLPEIRQWYDGYNFSGTEVYNPWSVISYFNNNCCPGLYWVNTSNNSILAELLKSANPRQKQELPDDLLGGHADAFAAGLNDYLETIASYYDTANREQFYHGFLLGLLALLAPDYAVRSNRESGYGRFDIAVFPSHDQPTGVIMEFKVADAENELSSKAREALAQIDRMDYLAEFRAQGAKEVWKYGIAFCGKKTQIAAAASTG